MMSNSLCDKEVHPVATLILAAVAFAAWTLVIVQMIRTGDGKGIAAITCLTPFVIGFLWWAATETCDHYRKPER